MIKTIKQIMTGHIVTVGILIAMMVVSTPSHAAQDLVQLMPDHAIKDDYVRLGDIFTNTNANASHVLAPTPVPGKALSLNTADLTRIANAFHLDWTADDHNTTITLHRAAQIITPDMITSALSASDLNDTVKGEMYIVLDDPSLSITIEGETALNLAIESVSYDPMTERFGAALVVSRDDERLSTKRITGTAYKMVKIPVFHTRLKPGDVIDANDLGFITVKARDITNTIAVNAADVIGMTPRRSTLTDKPILISEVTEPVLVRRNEFVTIKLNKGPIRLSTRGRAMSQGSRGETVRIMNNDSKTIIEAIVTGPQKAVVDQSI